MPRNSRGTELLERMRRQNKKWVGKRTFFRSVHSESKPPANAAVAGSDSDENGSARPPEDQRRGSSRASPQAAQTAPGQAPLAQQTAAHHKAVAIPGQAPLAVVNARAPPDLIQFFFHFHSVAPSLSIVQQRQQTLESNFITFRPKRKVLLDLGGSK